MRKLYTHKVTNYCGGGTIYLPPTEYRAERFAAIAVLASTHGIAVRICRCKNGDIPEAVCCHPTDSLVGSAAEAAEPAPSSPPEGGQLTLF
jgi:poly(3-hydroxybutyrate) depolymerase